MTSAEAVRPGNTSIRTEPVEFAAGDVTLRGDVVQAGPPAGATGRPAVVMMHGYGAVKDQYLHRFARVFAEAGLLVLLYDHRGFGASGGEPRQDIDAWVQVRDAQHALSYLRSRPDVAADRVGVWGTSFGGGHALVLGAIDPRVRCVVAQVPTISGAEAARRRVPPAQAGSVTATQVRDREAVYAGNPGQRRPLVDDDSGRPAVYSSPGAREFMDRPESRSATFVNEVTLQSLARSRDYEPGAYVARISPTPLLMVLTDADDVAFTDLQLDAYERARHPKRLVLLRGDHFAPYSERFAAAVQPARDWLVDHLVRRDPLLADTGGAS